jgi:glycosyltransferase involved in cell wall biosynthesis
VAADATSLPEVVGDAGLLVAPDDVSAWREALTRVLTDSELAADLAARGRARAALYTWERTARATRAVYAEAAGRGTPGGP